MIKKNPNYGKFQKPEGYVDLGWQVNPGSPTILNCVQSGHRDFKGPDYSIRQFDNSLFKNRCTDVITICDKCKYIYHTDMSD